MKKNKLNITTITSLILLSILSISCSKDNDINYINELKTSGKLLFNESNNQFITNANNSRSINTTEHNIELSFVSENPIPEFDSNDELKNYLQKNSSNINGTILFKIDGKIAYKSIVINGEKNKSIKTHLKVAYPCTFDGLSHCTQDRIDDMNWFDTTLCIIEGFGCVATNFASCGVDNC